MIECYYKWCEHHSIDEPFCENNNCTATDEQIIKFAELRKQELLYWDKLNKRNRNNDKS